MNLIVEPGGQLPGVLALWREPAWGLTWPERTESQLESPDFTVRSGGGSANLTSVDFSVPKPLWGIGCSLGDHWASRPPVLEWDWDSTWWDLQATIRVACTANIWIAGSLAPTHKRGHALAFRADQRDRRGRELECHEPSLCGDDLLPVVAWHSFELTWP
jgi:hypothetical protein